MNRLDRIKRLSDIVQKLLDDSTLSFEERRAAWLAAHKLRTAEALENAAKEHEDAKPKVTLGPLPDGFMERTIAENVARANELIRFDRSRFVITQDDAGPVMRQAAEAVRQRTIDTFAQRMVGQLGGMPRLEPPF